MFHYHQSLHLMQQGLSDLAIARAAQWVGRILVHYAFAPCRRAGWPSVLAGELDLHSDETEDPGRGRDQRALHTLGLDRVTRISRSLLVSSLDDAQQRIGHTEVDHDVRLW